MAQITFDPQTIPWIQTHTLATTWNWFAIPSWATAVYITPKTTDCAFIFNRNGAAVSGVTPTDGGAVGTSFQTVKTGETLPVPLSLDKDSSATQLFIATIGAGADVELMWVN